MSTQSRDLPSTNAVLGAPPGISHEDCGALPITRCVLHFPDGRHQAGVSYWQPTPQELELLNVDRPVRLVVLGVMHAPLSLGVNGDGFEVTGR